MNIEPKIKLNSITPPNSKIQTQIEILNKKFSYISTLFFIYPEIKYVDALSITDRALKNPKRSIKEILLENRELPFSLLKRIEISFKYFLAFSSRLVPSALGSLSRHLEDSFQIEQSKLEKIFETLSIEIDSILDLYLQALTESSLLLNTDEEVHKKAVSSLLSQKIAQKYGTIPELFLNSVADKKINIPYIDFFKEWNEHPCFPIHVIAQAFSLIFNPPLNYLSSYYLNSYFQKNLLHLIERGIEKTQTQKFSRSIFETLIETFEETRQSLLLDDPGKILAPVSLPWAHRAHPIIRKTFQVSRYHACTTSASLKQEISTSLPIDYLFQEVEKRYKKQTYFFLSKLTDPAYRDKHAVSILKILNNALAPQKPSSFSSLSNEKLFKKTGIALTSLINTSIEKAVDRELEKRERLNGILNRFLNPFSKIAGFFSSEELKGSDLLIKAPCSNLANYLIIPSIVRIFEHSLSIVLEKTTWHWAACALLSHFPSKNQLQL